jgi:hypothetical protein
VVMGRGYWTVLCRYVVIPLLRSVDTTGDKKRYLCVQWAIQPDAVEKDTKIQSSVDIARIHLSHSTQTGGDRILLGALSSIRCDMHSRKPSCRWGLRICTSG